MTPLSVLGGDGFCFSVGIEERLPNGAVGACTSAASDTGSCVVVWGSGFGIVEDFLCLGLDLERLPNGAVGACTSAASDTGSCVVVWGSGFGIVEDFLCLGLDLVDWEVVDLDPKGSELKG
nr:hypothetical protein CFP56_32662 [Quercus suber]